jgi:VWFA-related protein
MRAFLRRARTSVGRAGSPSLVVCLPGLVLAGVLVAEPQNQPAPLPQEKTPTLTVRTEVVNIYAVVRDKKRLVPNLTKEDFLVTEDGVPQQIRYFSRETDTPLTLVMMIDTSPSQEKVLPVEQEEAKAFLRQILRPKDMAAVLHFDLDVELLRDFTSDQARLAKAIDETVINGGGRGPLPGTFPTDSTPCCTHLYDAVYLAANDLLKSEVGRKVMILLTDGQDEGSKVKLETALEAAQKADCIIYALNITDRAFYRFEPFGYNGDSVLHKLTQETGGRVIRVGHVKDMAAAFQEIAEELRTQYLLGYTPTNRRHDGTFRRLQVKVRSGHYEVQARRGYYAPSD